MPLLYIVTIVEMWPNNNNIKETLGNKKKLFDFFLAKIDIICLFESDFINFN